MTMEGYDSVPDCHSERSEESLAQMRKKRHEID